MNKSVLFILGFSISILGSGCMSVEQLRTNIHLSLDERPRINSVIVLSVDEEKDE